jgi:phasin family protein
MIKSFEDFQTIGKDGFETYVASATAMTKGLQAIATETAEFSRKSFEKNTEVFQNAVAAKSFDKVVELQQAYAKEAYEAFVGQATKIGELYSAAAKEAYKPFESKFSSFGFKPLI